MILGSHNSWSYLTPRKWWMKLFRFVAQCQDYDIKTQYEQFGVRCFDLRLKFDDEGHTMVAHGLCNFRYSYSQILQDLIYLNAKRDCYVRVIHEVRNKKNYKPLYVSYFVNRCNYFFDVFPNIKFWCGENLYNHQKDFEFKERPSCEEVYASVKHPKLLDDWIPRLYAKLHNKTTFNKGTKKDILLIDFVNYR